MYGVYGVPLILSPIWLVLCLYFVKETLCDVYLIYRKSQYVCDCPCMHPCISWAFIQSIRCLSFKSCSRTYFSSEDWLLSICILKSTITFIGDELQKKDRKLPAELKDLILEWTDYGLLFSGDYSGAKSKCSLPNSCHTQSLSIIGSQAASAIWFPSLKILGV